MLPALTAVKLPLGGVARLLLFKPQQAIAPPLRSAQEWSLPALIAVKLPLGGAARLLVFRPQQAIVPVLRSPQLCHGAGAHGGERGWGGRDGLRIGIDGRVSLAAIAVVAAAAVPAAGDTDD